MRTMVGKTRFSGTWPGKRALYLTKAAQIQAVEQIKAHRCNSVLNSSPGEPQCNFRLVMWLSGLLLLLPGCQESVDRGDISPPATAAASPSPSPATSAAPAGISAEEDARIPPGPPGTVNVTQNGRRHVVEWRGTGDDTITGYQVYSRSTNREVWNTIGFVKLRADDTRNRGTYRFEKDVEPGCEYAVAAVGLAGKPGPKNVDIK